MSSPSKSQIKLLKKHLSFGGETRFYQHESRVTRGTMRFSCFVPPKPPKGCIIWLSGLTCTEENFISKAGAQRYLAEAQLMVICPDTSPRGVPVPANESNEIGFGAGFYVDATSPVYRDHFRMASYVSDELYALAQEHFDIGSRLSIMGHSMGGHGALTLALREPHKFAAVSAFSPICNPSEVPWGQNAFTAYLGDDRSAWAAYDSCSLLAAGHRFEGPLLVEQGTDDPFLLGELRPEALVKACKGNSTAEEQKLDLRYRKGYDHSYYFIASFIAEHITFHAAALEKRNQR